MGLTFPNVEIVDTLELELVLEILDELDVLVEILVLEIGRTGSLILLLLDIRPEIVVLLVVVDVLVLEVLDELDVLVEILVLEIGVFRGIGIGTSRGLTLIGVTTEVTTGVTVTGVTGVTGVTARVTGVTGVIGVTSDTGRLGPGRLEDLVVVFI